MLSEEERSEWLTRLRPWLRVLRERTYLPNDYDPHRMGPQEILWLRLPATREVDVRVVEAMELLTLVGCVDAQLWSVAMTTATRGSAFRVDGTYTDDNTVRRLGCVLSFTGFDEFPNMVMTWATRIVVGAYPTTSLNEYAYIRDWLESLVDQSSGEGTSVAPIAVKIWLHEGSFEERMEYLARVASLQQLNNNHIAEDQWQSLFEVIEMDAGTPDVVTVPALEAMVTIARRGILQERFRPIGMSVTPQTAIRVARGLQELFGMLPASTGVKQVELPVSMPSQAVVAVFSALHMSKSVRELRIHPSVPAWQLDLDDAPKMNPRERIHLWQWVAFAVFSPQTTHSLHEININAADLTIDDVRALRSQLELPEYVPVFPVQDGEDSLEVFDSAVASAWYSSSHEGQAVTQYPPLDILTIGKCTSDARRQILVPGYGLAWSEQGDIHINSQLADVQKGCVHDLTFDNVNRQSKDPVQAFLAVVGQGLTSVAIFGYDNNLGHLDSWFRGVFGACPRLERLIVRGCLHLQSMDVITEHLFRESCIIQQLHLSRLNCADLHSITKFFQALGTSTRRDPLLHSLQLTIAGLDDLESLVEIVESIGTALCTNHTLCRLTVRLSHPPHLRVPQLRHSVRQLTSVHNLEPICIRHAPLELDKKLAFLSVLTAAASTLLNQLLDRPLVSLVFEFAATCARRSVTIRLEREE